jgi:BASS family bile acid:Na+ symporter
MANRKFSFLALSQIIHHHLLWFLIGAYAIAAVFPAPGLWIRNLTLGDVSIFRTKYHVSLLLLLLATLMFNAGLGVKTAHLKSLSRQLRVLFAGLTANLVIPDRALQDRTPEEFAKEVAENHLCALMVTAVNSP